MTKEFYPRGGNRNSLLSVRPSLRRGPLRGKQQGERRPPHSCSAFRPGIRAQEYFISGLKKLASNFNMA